MNESKSFYITTTLPYVNADPHVGHAMEFIQADIIARWKKLCGYDVFFNTGTDEHGQKVWSKALEAKIDTQEYVDKNAKNFIDLLPLLGVSEDVHFIRTTNDGHKVAAQEMWKLCESAGDIYKKNYTIRYCVGCELEKTDSEIEDGHCIIHPHLELEIREEENYFFKFSKYGPRLLEEYEKNPSFLIPDYRLNEIKALIGRGLEDFSISRLKEKMPWGVMVPGDEKHVMYVWFDALVNYISTLGWPTNEDNFKKFWVEGTPTQFAGKDQVRQQAAMWQAMLLSAGLPLTKNIVIHGFVNYKGEKMSKSLGNVISPKDVVDEYGTDALRYFVAREFNQFEDTDISEEKLKVSYNANLANGLGNLTSRIMKMAETHLKEPVQCEYKIHDDLKNHLDKFEIQKAINHIWSEIGELDSIIQTKEPFKLIKVDEDRGKEIIVELVAKLEHIGHSLAPFLPETSEKILKAIEHNRLESPLFPRKD